MLKYLTKLKKAPLKQRFKISPNKNKKSPEKNLALKYRLKIFPHTNLLQTEWMPPIIKIFPKNILSWLGSFFHGWV